MTKFQKIILVIDIVLFAGSFFVPASMITLLMNSIGVILLVIAFAKPKK